MVNPTLSSCKPKAILPVQAIIFANVSDPPEQASLPEVRQRLRKEVHLVQPKENEQTLVYANTKGHEHFDMLSVLRKEVEESRKEREKSNKEREESNKEREKSEKVIEEFRKELEKFRKEREESRKETAEYRTIVDHHENQIEDHENQIEDHENQIEDHENQIEDLTAKVRDLTETSEGYLDIRKRFLDVYQRHRGSLNELQRKEIKKGNWRAHSGDSAVDAKLYREAGRSDGEVFQELYGVQVEQVWNLVDEVYKGTVDKSVLRILNVHGTQVASGNRFPTELENAFTSYLSEVYKESRDLISHKNSSQDTPYKSINNVAARARNFWNVYRLFQKSTQGIEF